MTYRTPLKKLTRAGEDMVAYYTAFAEAFLTYAGESELCGEPYRITPWMMKNIWRPLFGTGRMVGGKWRRQYRRALIGVHRSWGKSQIAASILLTVATMDPMPNGRYGIVADTKDNTKMVRDYIVTMIRANRELDKRWTVNKGQIRNEATGQEILVFPYKEAALQGKHFHVLIGDELHVWRDDAVWNAAVSGQAKVRNALTIGITTAGNDRDSFLFKQYQKLKSDPHAFICWLGISDSDNPRDRRCWKKIVAAGRITMEELEEQYNALPLDQFTRYYLNRTPMEIEETPFMKRADVERCEKVDIPLDPDKWFCVGVDGATSGDTLAVVCAQRVGDRWAFTEKCWDTVNHQGVYDLTDVADYLQILAASPGNPLIVCDPARLQFLKNWLERERGIELADVKQQPSVMCPASELLARAVKTGSAGFHGLEYLPRHCVNAKTDESKAYGRRITSDRHGKGSRRIDAAIAAAMAMYAYDNNEDEAPSAWVLDISI